MLINIYIYNKHVLNNIYLNSNIYFKFAIQQLIKDIISFFKYLLVIAREQYHTI